MQKLTPNNVEELLANIMEKVNIVAIAKWAWGNTETDPETDITFGLRLLTVSSRRCW
jgi:translation elongation factor EF-1beta